MTEASRDDGMHDRVPMDEYLSDPAVGSSSLWVLHSETPKHYRARIGTDPSEATVLGDLIHWLLLEPEAAKERYVMEPNLPEGYANPRGTKAYKDAVAALAESYPGLPVITTEMLERATEAVKAIREEAPAAELLDAPGVIEWSGWWTDPITGLRLKIRLDKYVQDIHYGSTSVQVKTCADVPRFLRDLERRGYYFREAFYRMVLEGLDLDPVHHSFLVAETKQPHDAVVYRLHEDAMDIGAREVRDALDTLARCMERDEWPGRGGGMVRNLNLPEYRLRQVQFAEGLEFMREDEDSETLEAA